MGDLKEDYVNCVEYMQQHGCSAYCMRRRKYKQQGEDSKSKKDEFADQVQELNKQQVNVILLALNSESVQQLHVI